jgi:hypothetical protein
MTLKGGGRRFADSILLGKTSVRRPLGRTKCGRKENISNGLS